MDFKKYLNDIYSELDTLLDTSTIPQNTDLEKEETPHLITTINYLEDKIKRQLDLIDRLKEEIIKYQELIEMETGDDKGDAVKEYNRLMTRMDRLLTVTNRYLTILDAPYFGKIQFLREQNEDFPAADLKIYLGKFALFDDKTLTPILTDWRAPIANLYYQNSGPTDNVSFTAPSGEQKGDLKQKRQFEISGARYHQIYDSKSGNAAADQFLLHQLETRMGKKLQDIVSTIQAQQNEIIRQDPYQPVIIQGVAGSGKTTIILHRLAYLFFTFPDDIKPENSLIIAPNSMFLDYISDVLPSLGVSDLQQNTFLNWAKTVLKWENKHVFSTVEANLDIKRFKGSQRYIKLLEIYFEHFLDDLFADLPDRNKYVIMERFNELITSHKDMDMMEALSLSVDYSFAQMQFKRKFAGNYMGNLETQRERQKTIHKYLNKRTDAYNLYKDMFTYPELFIQAGFTEKETKEIIKYSKTVLKSKSAIKFYNIEDLAPMAWLYLKIHRTKQHLKDYIVVDEAQDLSEFQLHTIAMVAKRDAITFAGDVAQAIIPPFYIQQWDGVQEMLGKQYDTDNVEYHQLFRCYRTTVEVIEFANKIFAEHFPKSYKLPEAVLRHGDPVETLKFSTNIENLTNNELQKLADIVNIQFDKKAATVAIVCHDESHANRVHQAVTKNKDMFKRRIYSYAESDYHDGILVLPVSRAKGLEFDTVILADVDNEHYPQNDLNVRLLYVAITRALHNLYITHSSEPSPLLPK